MTTVTTPRVDPAPPPVRDRQPLGRVLFGTLLMLLGGAWLLDASGAFDLRWTTALSVALIAVGVALLATARSGYHGSLVFLGFVLTPLLVFSSVVPSVNPVGGVGERVYAPSSVAALDDEYELGAGPLHLDLRDIAVAPGQEVPVKASVGAGELTVRVPEGVALEVSASSGAGEVTVLGKTRSGLGVEVSDTVAGSEGAGRFVLELSVGFGAIEVTR
jgi:hypothetical protein